MAKKREKWVGGFAWLTRVKKHPSSFPFEPWILAPYSPPLPWDKRQFIKASEKGRKCARQYKLATGQTFRPFCARNSTLFIKVYFSRTQITFKNSFNRCAVGSTTVHTHALSHSFAPSSFFSVCSKISVLTQREDVFLIGIDRCWNFVCSDFPFFSLSRSIVQLFSGYHGWFQALWVVHSLIRPCIYIYIYSAWLI